MRIGPVPLLWIPEGCTRGRRTPSEGGDQRSRRVANALVVQFGQDVGLSNQRSAFKSRPERADRWQKSPCARPQSESMQVRVLPDPFCRSGSRSRSARLVSGRNAGASPACGLGRAAQSDRTHPFLRVEVRVRIPSHPPCPRGLPDRTVAREATGGGSIPLGGVGHVV